MVRGNRAEVTAKDDGAVVTAPSGCYHHCSECITPSPREGRAGREFPETNRPLNPLTFEAPASSPSPPLEERAGERRPFPVHRGPGSWGGLGRGARFCAFDVVSRPLSLTLSPLLRRRERESFACEGGGIKMRPTACAPWTRSAWMRP